MKKYISILLLLLAFFVLLGGLSLAMLFWSYKSFTAEDPILVLAFEEKSENEFLVKIILPPEDRNEFLISGDQWRIDARFVKMKSLYQFLGIKSRYSLDRIQGRYKNINDENNFRSTAHQLNGENGEHFTFFGWSPFFDIEYGASVYSEIEVGEDFVVYKTTSGLLVRKENILQSGSKSWW